MSNNTQPEIRFPGFTEDWEERKLGDVFSERSERSSEGELISVTINSGVIKASELDRKDNSSDNKSNYKKVEVGDIAYNSMRMWQGASGYSSYEGILSPAYTVIIPKEGTDSKFFAYDFKRYDMIQTFKRNSQGLTSDTWNLKFPTLKLVKIMVPSIEEQKQIAAFFERLDNTIALHERELDVLKETKKGFLQKMFPKNGAKVPEIRFPGFTEDWEERKLGDMMDVTSVKRIHQSDWTNSGIRFLRARDIVSAAKNEEPSDYLYISEEKYNEYSKISGKVSQGDLLVTGVGSIGVPLLITDDNPIYFKDGNIIWFKNEHKIDGNFFYYSFINNKIQKYIRDVAGIGTVGTYTIDSGKKTPISLPTYDEQIKIGSFFKQLDHTIMLHQHELDLLKETKKGFLQKMFV
ncbi:restriction endonuclease subunit S [Enterococcus faecium]|uniref:restriction endonuclease subunit S n=1 Tax=Enterococcus faecium TaxID=1352 RepID=UPI001F5135E0|nr:restriction endonuclease subunit S [Enterococcus faecium]